MVKEKTEGYYRAVVDCWRLFQKYRDPMDAEAFWEKLNEDAAAVYERNQKSEFVKQMIFAVLNEIERIYETQRK